MPVNVLPTIGNADLAERWTILRNSGSFKIGGYSQDASQSLQFTGIASQASDRMLREVPEGDRVEGSMAFWSQKEMFETNSANSQTSDVLIWRGEQYRIYSVKPYPQRGYFRAIASRMTGQ